MNPQERKLEIRERIRERLRELSTEELEEAGRRVNENLKTLSLWSRAYKLAAFWPLNREPDIRPSLLEWLHLGRTLVLPRVEGPGPEEMSLLKITDPETDLITGAMKIKEPDPSRCLDFPPEKLHWIWIPGAAFDAAGRRMGRGRGYYDALLQRIPREIERVGIAFDLQICESPLPVEEWDQPVDWIVTDRRIIRPNHSCP